MEGLIAYMKIILTMVQKKQTQLIESTKELSLRERLLHRLFINRVNADIEKIKIMMYQQQQQALSSEDDSDYDDSSSSEEDTEVEPLHKQLCVN